MKKWQITLGMLVAVALVVGVSAVAFAQTGTPVTAGTGAGYGPMGRGAMAGRGNGQGASYGFQFGMNGQSLVDVTAQVTGLTTEQVVAELQTGKTFAQVAQAHGKTADDLINAFVAARKTVLAQAVADGRIDQATADSLLATMRTNVTQHVNSTWQPRGMGYRLTGQQPVPGTGAGQMQGQGRGRWNR